MPYCHAHFFFFQAEDGIRDSSVTGVQTCALPIYGAHVRGLGLQGRLHTWKGAEATLKPKPTNMSAVATYARTGTLPERSTWLIASMLVDPVAPNMSATP